MTIELSEQQKIKLLNSDDVYNVMQEILLREEKLDQEREHFWIVGLAQNNRMQYIELISLGSVNKTTVEPMNVFRLAVMKGSVKVILVHNHPSGELMPSDIDKDLTDRLIQTGKILDIEVIDHMIISPKSYLSFANTGLLKELEQSIKWTPKYEVVEQIKKIEKKIRIEAVKTAKEKGVKKGKQEGIIEGKKEKAIEIAKGLKMDGISLEIISKNTGLTLDEIKKII